MAKAIYDNIQDEIQALKREHNAVIVAHNYQVGEVQDVADFLGDSLNLARWAKQSNHHCVVVGTPINILNGEAKPI